MSEAMKAKIASELALLVQLVPFPSSPFYYGTDISCDTDLDPTLAEVQGDTILALAQALVRRLDCPRGENPDDPNYGIGVRQFLNTAQTERDINQLGGQIRLELLKDDRVDSLAVIVTPSNVGKNLRIEIQVVPVDMDLGPFTLTLNASSASILLEAIGSER